MISGAEPQHAETAPSKEKSSIWQWFYLPSGYVPFIARLTALCALPCALLLSIGAQSDPASYIVPTWRFGTRLIELPSFAPPITIGIFVIYAVSCLWLIFGPFHKLPVTIAACTIAYFGSRDLMASHCSFVTVIFTFLIALLFAHKERASCTRRLIQISTIAVYFYSVFWKLIFPGFINGESFEAEFADGWALKTIWVPVLMMIKPNLLFWQISSWFTILIEGFIAFGLAFKPWRKWALISGLVLHAGIAIFLDKEYILTIFSIIMCTGYLAFVEPPLRATEAPSDGENATDAALPAEEKPAAPDRLEGSLAGLFALAMIFIPMRILFCPDRPVNSIYLFDRSPWNYSMFLMRIEFESVSAKYKDARENWHTVYESNKSGTVSGLEAKTWTRSSQTTVSTDNQLMMMANLIFSKYPDAKEVEIASEYLMNRRHVQKKVLTMSKDAEPKIAVYDSESKPGQSPSTP